MTATDYGTLIGMIIGVWGTGFAAGIFWRAVKRVIEKALGVGTL